VLALNYANYIPVVATLNDSVQLPQATGSGLGMLVVHLGAAIMQIFPAVGDKINGNAVSAAATMTAKHSDFLIDIAPGQWVSVSGWIA
jgi:hypothetical protein